MVYKRFWIFAWVDQKPFHNFLRKQLTLGRVVLKIENCYPLLNTFLLIPFSSFYQHLHHLGPQTAGGQISSTYLLPRTTAQNLELMLSIRASRPTGLLFFLLHESANIHIRNIGLMWTVNYCHEQTWGQVLIIVLESSISTFINPQVQVQVKVLSTYVKYKYTNKYKYFWN